MKKKLFIVITFLLSTLSVTAKQNLPVVMLERSKQLIVVTTPNWEASSGQLQRYERKDKKEHWQPVGEPISVVVGKNGLAWGMNLGHQSSIAGLMKKEGDLKSPAGIFSIGPAFGFAPGYIKNIKLPYIQLMSSSVCVDDTNSKYYNQIINSSKIKKPDWKSGEQMRQIPQYMWGIALNYNSPHPNPGSGSCVFLHIWKDKQGTQGCVAMAEPQVEQMITWINPAEKPLIVILPKHEYRSLEKSWGLPA
jgi:L,D-peptidoglycan transpeptidase YkuD (ErfK/YbiS/YcfS/YnhG family)